MNEMTAPPTELTTKTALPLQQMLDPEYLTRISEFATRIAGSQLIPERFQNKPDDLFIALHMAGQMRCDWLQLVQNLYVVHGSPGFSAKFIIAQANASGVFTGSIRFKAIKGTDSFVVGGKTWVNHAITAYAYPKGDDEPVEFTVDMKMAVAEGWTKNPKYTSMPQLMLRYRAATFLVRTHCPEVMFGYQTAEELEDMGKGQNRNTYEGETSAPSPELSDVTGTDLNALVDEQKPRRKRRPRATPQAPETQTVAPQAPEESPAEPGTERPERRTNDASSEETTERDPDTVDLDTGKTDREIETEGTGEPTTERDPTEKSPDIASAFGAATPDEPAVQPDPKVALKQVLEAMSVAPTPDKVDLAYDQYIDNILDTDVVAVQEAAQARCEELDQAAGKASPEEKKTDLMKRIVAATSLMQIEELREEADRVLAGTGSLKGAVTKAMGIRIRELRKRAT